MRALLLTLMLMIFAAPAFAQAPTSTAAAPAAEPAKPADLPPGFQPLPGAEARAESVNANLLVVLAYAAFFASLFGFVIYVVRSQSAMAKEIEELSRKLESKR